MCTAKECESCEFAIYCFSDESTWVFRTKQEMKDKLEIISKCPIRRAYLEKQAASAQKEEAAQVAETGL